METKNNDVARQSSSTQGTDLGQNIFPPPGLHYMWKRGKETRRRRVENEIRGKKRKKKKKGKRRKKIIKILYK